LVCPLPSYGLLKKGDIMKPEKQSKPKQDTFKEIAPGVYSRGAIELDLRLNEPAKPSPRYKEAKTYDDIYSLLEYDISEHNEVYAVGLVVVVTLAHKLRREYTHKGFILPDVPKEPHELMNHCTTCQQIISSELQSKPSGEVEDTTEHSLPLAWNKWAGIFGVDTKTLRRFKDRGQYRFRKVSDRRWTLPISELPAEYMEKYRQATTKKPETERQIDAQI